MKTATPTKMYFLHNTANQILLGMLLGIIVGLFFGENSSIFKPIGNIYATLLQAFVYPYIICALISGLGRLTPAMTYKLLKRGWPIYVLVVVLTFVIMVILSLAIPETISLDLHVSQNKAAPQLEDLLFSGNIFSALSQNHLPAVIIFCVLFALVLQRIPKDLDKLFDILDVISTVCIEFWRLLVKFAPIAVFAMMAYVAGTVDVDQLTNAGEFLLLFMIGSAILIFWVLPILISNLVPIPYKTLFSEFRDALIIVITTTHAVLALPFIKTSVYKFIHTPEKDKAVANEVIDTVMVLSYTFAHLGNYFIYLFIIFASLYFNHPLDDTQQLWLPLFTFFSSIGSQGTTINAISFLSEWLNIPGDVRGLYLSMYPLIQYNEVLVSLLGIICVTLLITWGYFHQFTIRLFSLLVHLTAVLLILIAIVVGIKFTLPDPAQTLYEKFNSLDLSDSLKEGVKTKFLPALDEENLKPDKGSRGPLEEIQQRGVLRVGYNPNEPPFVFFNAHHELVGYDVAYIYALAQSLHANVEFIPYTFPHLVTDMEADAFDIAIGGIYVTTTRLYDVSFSLPVFEVSPSLLVPASQEDQFNSVEKLRKIKGLRIGILNGPTFVPLVKEKIPNAQIVLIDQVHGGIREAFEKDRIDVFLWSEAQTNVWALAHEGYASIKLPDFAPPFMLAFMVQRESDQFLNYLNYWLGIQKNSGFDQKNYNKWILVQPEVNKKTRWSILQDVLHWGQ